MPSKCPVEIQGMFEKKIGKPLPAFIYSGIGRLVGITPDSSIANFFEIIKTYFCSGIETVIQSVDDANVCISIAEDLGKIVRLLVKSSIGNVVAGIRRNIRCSHAPSLRIGLNSVVLWSLHSDDGKRKRRFIKSIDATAW